MKKLNIIAGLVFATIFFASCENKEVMPQVNNLNVITQTVDFQEPEFISQKRPIVNATESTIVPAATAVAYGTENKLEQ